MMIISIDTIEVRTLSPDGSDYKLLDTDNLLKKNRIGEYKKIKINYSSTESIDNVNLFFVPALCFTSGMVTPFTDAPTGSFYSYAIGAVVPGTYSMNLTVSVGYPADLIKNESVNLIITNETTFSIEIQFYQIYDLNGFLNPASETNKFKLLKDLSSNIPILTVSGDSVYTSDKHRPQFYLFIQKTADLTNKNSLVATADGYQGGFYAKNELNTDPYFTDQEFIFEDPDGNPITQISSAFDTKVRFRVTAPDIVGDVIVWLIKTSSNNNSVDMKTNYDASHYQMITVVPAATLANKIKAPSHASFLDTGKYEIYFHIDKTLVLPGESYRVIAIPYYEEGDVFEVNSFISDEYPVGTPSFTGVGYEFTGSIKDFQKEYLGNDLICVVEERMQSILKLDYSSDAFADDMLDRLGLTVPNDIQRYLTQIRAEVYYDVGLYRHYMLRSTATKSFFGSYVFPAELQLFFTTDNFEVRFNYRNGYTNTPNLQSTYNGLPLPLPTSNQNWAGRTMKVKFTLDLFYDDYSTPFTDEITFIQTIRPKGYGQEVRILKDDGTSIGNAEYFCSDESSCFKANLSLPNPEKYKLITNIELAPGSPYTISETEEWTGVLGQLISPKIASQEVSFSQTAATFAKFCLNNSLFRLDLSYKISAIAKKEPVDPLAKQFEDGDPFEFEDGAVYQFEN